MKINHLMILQHPPKSKNKTTLDLKDDGFVIKSTIRDFGNDAANRYVSRYGHFLKANNAEKELIYNVYSGKGTVNTTCTSNLNTADYVEYDCVTERNLPNYYDTKSETIRLYDGKLYTVYEKEEYYNGNESMIKSVGTVKNPE